MTKFSQMWVRLLILAQERASMIGRKRVAMPGMESNATWSVTLSTRAGEDVFMRKRVVTVGEEVETIQ